MNRPYLKLNLQMSNFHYKDKSMLDTIKFPTISIQIYAPQQSQLSSFMQHLTLKKIIELNAPNNWSTFCPL